MTRTLSIETPQQFEEAVRLAAEFLRRDEVVAVPTETVYGLAAHALRREAVEKIFQVKGRPAENPVIVHVASLGLARSCVAEWTEKAAALAEKFWPGPLTLVLRKAECIPDIVTASGPTVGLRWPAHPFMQRLIQHCGFPLAAPSANTANQLSPTTAAHVLRDLGGRIPLIIDAGPAAVGIESTVVDLSSPTPQILRPGMISAEQIQTVLGRLEKPGGPREGPLRSPGQLRKHYSPRARLLIRKWADERDLRQIAAASGARPEKTHIIAHEVIPAENGFAGVSVIPADPEAYARAIYAELHRCDEENAEVILIEELPQTIEWEGIRDRLSRAAAEN